MKKFWLVSLGLSAAGLFGVPGSASAQQAAFTNAPADVFAGPAPDYPVVSQLPQGIQLTVYGCTEGYSWCDVAVPNLRGWVDASTLSYPYQGNYVPLETYGATIGLPIVAFSVGAYWGSYYRGQPWYHEQQRWINHPPPRPGPGYGHPSPPYGGGRPPGPGGPPRGNEGVAGRPPGPPQGNYGRPPGPGPGREPGHEEARPEHRGGGDDHGHPPPQ